MTSAAATRREVLVSSALALLGCRRSTGPTAERIVSAGAAVTETLFALGAGSRVVGVDSSSVAIPAARGVTQVGYVRALSAEGVLSLAPTLLIASHEAGPPPALARLRQSGVPVIVLDEAQSRESAIERVGRIAAAVKRDPEGARLCAQMRSELDAVRPTARKRVLFVYARGGGTLNVAGQRSAADAMIGLAGSTNAVTSYEGYRPLTAEALVQAQPEVLLFTERGLQSVGGVEGALRLPGVTLTPAGRARAVIAMEDALLLGFGPRLGQASATLARLIAQSAA